MRPSLLTALAWFIATSAVAAGLGTTDRMYVDGVSVDAKNGAVTLLLVIDFPLEDGLTKPRARSKILSYVNWMQSKKFAETYPQAKPKNGSQLLIVHVPPRNALGSSALSQIEGYARELGFTTRLQVAQPTSGTK